MNLTIQDMSRSWTSRRKAKTCGGDLNGGNAGSAIAAIEDWKIYPRDWSTRTVSLSHSNCHGRNLGHPEHWPLWGLKALRKSTRSSVLVRPRDDLERKQGRCPCLLRLPGGPPATRCNESQSELSTASRPLSALVRAGNWNPAACSGYEHPSSVPPGFAAPRTTWSHLPRSCTSRERVRSWRRQILLQGRPRLASKASRFMTVGSTHYCGWGWFDHFDYSGSIRHLYST